MRAPRVCLAVGGPTATGKTTLAVALALRVGGELVNADSRQVMRRLRAGTATPTPEELRGVPCHLLDQTEPGTTLTAAEWVRRAREAVGAIEQAGRVPILVGGTGQYIRALREGWTFGGGAADPGERMELTRLAGSPEGLAGLVTELRNRDPGGAATVDVRNPRRVVRALEVLRSGVATLAEAHHREGAREVALVVLDADRALQLRTIDQRVAAMFDHGGLIREVRAELERGTSPEALRRAGIGYAEGVDVVAGRLGTDAASASARHRTLRYAKAQRTWFRQEAAALRPLRSEGVPPDALVDEVLSATARPAAVSR